MGCKTKCTQSLYKCDGYLIIATDVGRWRGRGPNWSLGLLHGINEDLLFPQALLHLNTDQLPWLCEVSSAATPWKDDSTMCTSQEHPYIFIYSSGLNAKVFFYCHVRQLSRVWFTLPRVFPVAPQFSTPVFGQSLLSRPAMFNKTFGSSDFCISTVIFELNNWGPIFLFIKNGVDRSYTIYKSGYNLILSKCAMKK